MATEKKRKIEELELSELVADPNNPRVRDAKANAALASSLERFGAGRSVLVDSDGIVRAGNGTLEAARAAGITKAVVVETEGDELVVVRRKDLKGPEAIAYGIVDNRTGEMAKWDDKILRSNLAAIGDAVAMDLPKTSLHEMLGNMGVPSLAKLDAQQKQLEEVDAAPPPSDPISKLGDLWLLGKHRLVCGDSTKVEDVTRALGDIAPKLMVTDPPYGVEYDPEWRENVGHGAKSIGKVDNDDRIDWTAAWKLFPGDVVYVWHGGKSAGEVAATLVACDFEIRAQIIWVKHHLIISRGHYHWRHEPCWYAVKKGATAGWNPGYCDVIVDRWQRLTGSKAVRG